MNDGRHPGKSTVDAVPCEDRGRYSSSPHWYYEEQNSKENTNYATSVEVVRPYAIEEPDDGEGQADQTQESTGSTPQWQRDLVDSMDGLECQSDTSGSPLRSDHTRGRKRKPANTVPQDSQPAQSPPVEPILQPPSEAHHEEGPDMSPKRRCRMSKDMQSVDLDAVDAAFQLHASRETRPTGACSTDANSAGYTVNEPAPPDGMDVD